LVQLSKGGGVLEYHEVTVLTPGAPNRIDFDRALINSYTGIASHKLDTISATGAIKLYNPYLTAGYPYTGTKLQLTNAYGPSTIANRGNDYVIVGDVDADTEGYRIPFGNPSGRGQILAGNTFVQIADADITNALDNIWVTPLTTTAVSGAPYVTAINAPAGTFQVNVPVAPAGNWDFMYGICKYEIPR
jgi:hypothetical protein